MGETTVRKNLRSWQHGLIIN